MTKREWEILEILRKDPTISQREIANKLNIARSSVGVHIKNLIAKGYIKGRGYILAKDEYITVIGGANVDIVGSPQSSLIDYDSNPGKINISCGGVARNIGENLVRLGLDTRLITAISDDSNGKLIKNQATSLGLDLTNSLFLEGKRTASYLAILDESHDMKLAISDMDIIEELSPEVIKGKKDLIENSKLSVLDTNLRQDSLAYILENFNQDFFVDTVSTVKSKKVLGLLPYIHTLKPNEYEAGYLSRIRIDNEKDLIKAGKKLVDQGVERVFITLGEEGLFYFDKNEIIKVKSSKIDVENSTGAGDAFMAGLAYSRFMDYSIEDTLYTAVGASRLAVKDLDTISSSLNINNIKKEKGEIEIC